MSNGLKKNKICEQFDNKNRKKEITDKQQAEE